MTTAFVDRSFPPGNVQLRHLQLVYVPGIVDVEEVDLLAAHVDQHLGTGAVERYVSGGEFEVG